jgi:hypothetical protein
MMLSNKAMLVKLWELNKGHDLLLPSYFNESELTDGTWCKKAIHGREGSNIHKVVRNFGTTVSDDIAQGSHKVPEYDKWGYMYQQWHDLPVHDGYKPILGSWVIGDKACGMSVREDPNDVTGKSYQMRLTGMALGAALTCFVFYRNHKNRTYKRNLNDLVQEFDISSSRTKWQLCQIICVPAVLCIAELCNMPRAMWAGIAAMSAILPFMEDMQYRVRKRIVGNIAGVICFTVLYFLLPSSIYTYIGILGGIGVGLSAKYGWQAVFNTFGALAIATESYGLKEAVGLRVIQNVFGVVFALIFCSMFYWLMSKKKETVVTVAAK